MEGETALSKCVVAEEVVKEANDAICPLPNAHPLVYDLLWKKNSSSLTIKVKGS